MNCTEYANAILNIILNTANMVEDSNIQIKTDYLYKNKNELLYIYSTDNTSNIIRLLPYNVIINSYATWVASGAGDSAFLSMLADFIARLCGPYAELYLNTILKMMRVPTNDSSSE